MLAALPWTYWLGVAWSAVAVMTLVVLAVTYVRKVHRLEVTLRQARLFGNDRPQAGRDSAAVLGRGAPPRRLA